MSSSFSRKVQIVIDKIRRKQRSVDPMQAFSMSPRVARQHANPSSKLEKLFYGHHGRIAHKWHHYLAIYERHFQCLQASLQRPPHILELGVSQGGSLQLWQKYFGSGARIVGVDIDSDCADRCDPGSFVVIGNQADSSVLSTAIEQLGGTVDLVIDDGSHFGGHQIASFQYLYPRLSPYGLYVCEDIQCCYSSDYGGGLRRDGTFVEYTKDLIDQLHAWHLDDVSKERFLEFARSTYGIFFYLDVVVIEKRPVQTPFHVRMGKVQRKS